MRSFSQLSVSLIYVYDESSSRMEAEKDGITLRKPADSRRAAADLTAWKGVGEALRKLMRLVAASGPAWGSIIV